jgi:hypothetical protein
MRSALALALTLAAHGAAGVRFETRTLADTHGGYSATDYAAEFGDTGMPDDNLAPLPATARNTLPLPVEIAQRSRPQDNPAAAEIAQVRAVDGKSIRIL